MIEQKHLKHIGNIGVMKLFLKSKFQEKRDDVYCLMYRNYVEQYRQLARLIRDGTKQDDYGRNELDIMKISENSKFEYIIRRTNEHKFKDHKIAIYSFKEYNSHENVLKKDNTFDRFLASRANSHESANAASVQMSYMSMNSSGGDVGRVFGLGRRGVVKKRSNIEKGTILHQQILIAYLINIIILIYGDISLLIIANEDTNIRQLYQIREHFYYLKNSFFISFQLNRYLLIW
jgi:hypothetical protein